VETSDKITHRVAWCGFVGVTIILVLSVLACCGERANVQGTAFAIDGVPISNDAKNILWYKMREIITTDTNPSEREFFGKKQRQGYTAIDTWKREIIRIGRSYDERIEDGQSFLEYSVRRNVHQPNAGHDLARKWQKDIDDEGIRNRDELFFPKKKMTPRSRKEIIQAHPHVEAIIYLSRVLSSHPTDVPLEVLSVDIGLSCGR